MWGLAYMYEGIQRDLKRVLKPLELELHRLEFLKMGAGNQTQVLFDSKCS